ncbi:type 1 glutamine amidotransferase family protein [Agrobacterium vitis]|uniref:type 1 glutamine amidotransferase family protein n=1 Tax=Agrobacterium vitis TaxID=373 RepID=UPI0012E88B4B|nr:type 1 glutamine amidotransferase family protein [Agrobacterium vitis]MUZ64028.1 glutamine amidotransferase [Agrobacterium vitis]
MARIAIALAEDYADWEIALLTAMSRSFLDVDIVYASPDGAPVTSMGGLKVTPDCAYAALKADTFNALVIPGGMSWEKGNAPDLSGLVDGFRINDKLIAGICAAASALAGTGILNGVSHTGNGLAAHKAYAAYLGDARYKDQPQAVSDGGVITAAGTASFTFTVEILKALDLWTPEVQAEMDGFAAEYS